MQSHTATTLEKMFSLEGKRGILTGGSSGLGLATSQVLADADQVICENRPRALALMSHLGLQKKHHFQFSKQSFKAF